MGKMLRWGARMDRLEQRLAHVTAVKAAKGAEAQELAAYTQRVRSLMAEEEAYRAAHPNWQAEVQAERRAMEEWERRGFP